MADQPPPGGWEAWQLLSVPALAAAAAAAPWSKLWGGLLWLIGRRDKQAEQQLSAAEKIQADLLAQRGALTSEQAAMFDRLRGELTRLYARLEEVEKDRDRGWDLARWWNRRCWQIRHEAGNARTAAEGLAANQGITAPPWKGDLDLPGLEDPT